MSWLDEKVRFPPQGVFTLSDATSTLHIYAAYVASGRYGKASMAGTGNPASQDFLE